MAYEYNLRRLFRPQVDQLPLSEQLSIYHQRDLTYSHLYRLGTDLFGRSGIRTRRRLIDASVCSPQSLVPHRTLLQRSLDGKSPTPFHMHRHKKFEIESSTVNLEALFPMLTNDGSLDLNKTGTGSDNPLGVIADDFTTMWQRNWIRERECVGVWTI